MADDHHPPDTAVDDYLDDALDEAARTAFEAHASACEMCAARLARAARAEVVLLELAGEPPAKHRSRRWPMIGAAVAIAAAAAALLVVQHARDKHVDGPTRVTQVAEPTTTNEPGDLQATPMAVVDDGVELPSTAELTVFIPEAEP